MKRNATMILFSLLAILFSFSPTQAMAKSKRKTCTLKLKMINKLHNKKVGQRSIYVYKIKAQRKGGTVFGRQKCFYSRNGDFIKMGGQKTYSCNVRIRKKKSCNSKWKIFIAWKNWGNANRDSAQTDNDFAVWKKPSNGQLTFTFK